METSPQRPSLRTIINKKRPKSKLLAGNRLWIRGNFFVEGRGHKLWNCRQFSPFPRPRGRKNSPVRPADGRILISYPENHRSYPQKATIAPPVLRKKLPVPRPPGRRKRPFAPLRAEKEGGLCPPPGQNALPAAGKCLADSKRNARGRAMFPPVLAEKYAGGGENAAGRAARFPFGPPQGKVWRAAGDRRECPAPLSPFSRCGRKRRADGGRFCRFACPTPPHMV